MSMNTNASDNTRNNIIPHDSTSRGYSVQNSFYDSPYNMDFEYGYLNLIVNISSFTARTQDMFLNLESNLSNIIELQNERRRYDLEAREAREARENNENSNISRPASQPASPPASSHESRQNIFPSSRRTSSSSSTTNTPAPPPPSLPNNNLNSIFGTRNVFLGLNPNTLYNNNNNNNNTPSLGQTANRGIRRNYNGLTIQEIEENTEIVNYDSIDADQILNTECPISRDVFNSTSIVLRLKECRHCFVPFRIMTWLESHSTCPLCRCNVAPAAPAPAPAAAAPAPAPTTPTTTFSNILNNIRNNSNLDNLSIDNINDDSFVFSFDLPRPTINAAQGQDFTNAYISTLSQILSNTYNARTTQNNETSDTADTAANTENNETNNVYEEVD